MSERENIANCDGNIEALRRYENRLASGEEQLEQTQEEMNDELDELIEEFLENVKLIAKREHYDLKDQALEYVKDMI